MTDDNLTAPEPEDPDFDKPIEFPLEIIADVENEMQAARAAGWSVEHDRSEGSGHLQHEAVYGLTHMGEYPTDAAVRHEFIVAIGLLVNAVKVLDYAVQDGHTVVLGDLSMATNRGDGGGFLNGDV